MSDCIGAPANQWLEQYVEGTLPEEEAQKFEDHYFECPVCLAQLQALQAVTAQLQHHPVAVPQRARVFTWPVIVSFGALAASLAIGLVTLRMFNSAPRPGPTHAVVQPANPPANSGSPAGSEQEQIASLADLRPPVYHPSTLRDASGSSAFRQGMASYAAGDCASAIARLAHVSPHGDDALAAQFYIGVCQAHTGNPAAAATLRRVSAAGDTPFQESALYYLAQIALARSDAAEARSELNKIVSLHGDLQQRAQEQLNQLEQSTKQK